MGNYRYGIINEIKEQVSENKTISEMREVGFTVLESVFPKNQMVVAEEKLYKILEQQENEFGKENLERINEKDTVRCPLAFDEFFLEMACNRELIKLMQQLLGEYFILHLQNGVINKKEGHHQTSWHRDLPYQNFVISKPLAISAFVCVTDFTTSNGATKLIPESHKKTEIKETDFALATQITAHAGSVIIFDSMVVHAAGNNTTDTPRIGINHVYSSPIIKQQISLPKCLNPTCKKDEFLHKFLGYDSDTPNDVNAFRKRRLSRL